MEIRKLVIATDGSPASAAALDFGLELARDRGAEAVVLFVAATRDAGHLFDPERLEPPSQAELADASDALDQALKFAHGQSVAVTLELVAADGTDAVADAILGVAAGRDADAIVVGTRGHGRIANAVLGSVSNAVLRDATATVIVVREPAVQA